MAAFIMTPPPGTRLVGFIGDRVRFSLRFDGPLPSGWRALVRTNLGRAHSERVTVVATHGQGHTFGGASWRDIPMEQQGDEWVLELTLNRVGFFHVKPYALDTQRKQQWPDGDDIGLSVHPNAQRTNNTIYCAFVRAFGNSKHHSTTRNGMLEEQFAAFDRHGYTLIPPSGTLRDLTAQIPHIVDQLGCHIIHLLPICRTPTTYARMGRFGSPYAATDLTAIDPALVVFDQRTTAVDQFRELTYAAHLKGARVYIDLAINHTGWGSRLLDEHPEWFMRNADGTFKSPGAWGVTWGDLVELEHQHNFGLWDSCADAFLEWCRRGVDGFRCDAGYMVPKQAWQFITARVRMEFPDVIFLLEGLGGAWSATESLLTEGGMQWAYSELFQNYSGREIAHYLDHCHYQSRRVGVLVHYSETHDNERLAKGGRLWSLMRNHLSALTSSCGAFGFTCGVEWLATEKVNVHESRGLSWGHKDNIVPELSLLTSLVSDHPCFFDGAQLTRWSTDDAPVYVLHRNSFEGKDQVIVLVNTDAGRAQQARFPASAFSLAGSPTINLLAAKTASDPIRYRIDDDSVIIDLTPGQSLCLSTSAEAKGLAGNAYRDSRARAAWAIWVLGYIIDVEHIGPHDWRDLSELVYHHPAAFAGCLNRLNIALAQHDLMAALRSAIQSFGPPQAATWNVRDAQRIMPVAHHYALIIRDTVPFSISVKSLDSATILTNRAVPVIDGYVACIPRPPAVGHARLVLQRYTDEGRQIVGPLLFFPSQPLPPTKLPNDGVALLTNGLGGMARLQVDFGSIASKYDCLLAANLHPRVPSDRHVLIKRLRLWVNADGFISPLNSGNLQSFHQGAPANWTFVANAGDNRTVTLRLDIDLLDGRNTAVIRLSRPAGKTLSGRDLPDECDVRVTTRFDLEDRSFHNETKRSDAGDEHFTKHASRLAQRVGFSFEPAPDRRLRVYASDGVYHSQNEWSQNIPHPIEANRGHTPTGDAWSPGWFDLPLIRGQHINLVACADADEPTDLQVTNFISARHAFIKKCEQTAGLAPNDLLGQTLVRAVSAYVVRRDDLKTVIAGYPWFLDWGRDSLICARGMIAAGMIDAVRELLISFGRFEQNGTLPNCIHGDDASNRETSDAPLWYGIVCEELAEVVGPSLYQQRVDQNGRTIADVLLGIARGYLGGTPTGIRVDTESGLVYSPAHFTWMDTNHPAGTPREGYPIEIQVLWIRLLRLVDSLQLATVNQPWSAIADLAQKQLDERYWIEDRGYYADLLIASAGQSAKAAIRDNALRSNQVLAVALGLITGDRARRTIVATARYLFVPGALRSLAPLPIDPPLPVLDHQGKLLNDPVNPYWGRYEGDEDTRRKPAYHNGTAWTWTFPGACEAVARAWDFDPSAIETARAYLASIEYLINSGCHGHLPEILDGDAPHTQRGCDAQAWGATEALRVWKLLMKAKEKI